MNRLFVYDVYDTNTPKEMLESIKEHNPELLRVLPSGVIGVKTSVYSKYQSVIEKFKDKQYVTYSEFSKTQSDVSEAYNTIMAYLRLNNHLMQHLTEDGFKDELISDEIIVSLKLKTGETISVNSETQKLTVTTAATTKTEIEEGIKKAIVSRTKVTSIRVEPELYENFKAILDAQGMQISHVISDFIKIQVKANNKVNDLITRSEGLIKPVSEYNEYTGWRKFKEFNNNILKFNKKEIQEFIIKEVEETNKNFGEPFINPEDVRMYFTGVTVDGKYTFFLSIE